MKPRAISTYNPQRGACAAQSSRCRAASRRGGFTVIEIVIVMGIAALISAITLGGISSIGASNRRTQCQTNLSQIYQACRLYQADYSQFPYYNPAAVSAVGPTKSIGLWSLYSYPCDSHDPDDKTDLAVAEGSPLGAYLRSPRVLHCPQDTTPGHGNLISATDKCPVGNVNVFNNDYLSYQMPDPASASDSVGAFDTYKPVRTASGSEKRQLVPWNGTSAASRPPADDTVVTWCFWHRKAVGGRNYDNVLFYDGSVQLVSRQQENPIAGSPPLTGWQRIPRRNF